MSYRARLDFLPFATRKELASKLIECNFNNREMGILADWLNTEAKEAFTAAQVKGFSQKLKQAILKPHICKDAGMIAICRQLEVIRL